MPEIPDIDRLIAEVAARHGILLKKDDAAFALVTLNRLVLESAIADLVTRMSAATEDFEKAAELVQKKAGLEVARQVNLTVQAFSEGLHLVHQTAPGLPIQPPAASQWNLLCPFLLGLVVGALISRIW